MQNTTKRLFLGFSVKKTLECQFFDMQQKLTLYINTEALAVLQSNMHITLGFLGQVKPSCIPALLTEVDALEKPSFELVLAKTTNHLFTRPGSYTTFNHGLTSSADSCQAWFASKYISLLSPSHPLSTGKLYDFTSTPRHRFERLTPR